MTCKEKDVILIYSSKLMKINNINFERLVIFLSKKPKEKTSEITDFLFYAKKIKNFQKSIDIIFEL